MSGSPTRLYAVRIDNIRDGIGSADRANGGYFFRGSSTVFDDGTGDGCSSEE